MNYNKKNPNILVDNQTVDRMKSAFISLISHELRTPLTYISSSVEMLEIALSEPSLSKEIPEFIRIISKGVKQLNSIIDELLLFSSLERSKSDFTELNLQEKVNLENLIKDVVNSLTLYIKNKNIEIKYDFTESIIITTDPGKLFEVILQLVSNAIKFSPNNSIINIKTESIKNSVRIHIIDSGPGIKKENLENIFKPFFQEEEHLRREHGGLGLGLTLAHRIIKSLGGEITLTNTSDKGSCFSINLPIIHSLKKENIVLNSRLEQLQNHIQKSVKQVQEQKNHISSLKKQLWQYAIDLKNSYKKEKARSLELENAYIDMVKVLAAAIDTRDKFTKGHSSRVTDYSLKIANAFGCSKEIISYLKTGGMLHDIGMIGISDSILNKKENEPLTEEDIKHIRLHPIIGANILKDIKLLEPIIPIVLYHHEHYDGNGYPEGLKGEEIPIMVRILSIADAFDAITSDRPYRKGRSKKEAIKEIQKCAGTQFDPEIVEVFTKLIQNQDFCPDIN